MVLQFGKLPPPIGGVSIHIQRLLMAFENRSINVELLDYSKERNLLTILQKIYKCKTVHLHLSRKFHRLLFIILFRLLYKKVIVTFHGEIDFVNYFDYLSLKFSNYPIFLNQTSYVKALKYRKFNIKLIGAFIPPPIKPDISLLQSSIDKVICFKEKYKYVFCTNASNVVFDKEDNEIYGGSLLIDIFIKNPSFALVFSDPSSNYEKYLLKKFKQLPSNVFFINYTHDFTDVIKICDAFIRSTTTDGDSLSVQEALFLNKNVIASDVIDRPLGCILYKNIHELEIIITHFNNYKLANRQYIYKSNIIEIEKVYRKIEAKI